MRGKEFALWKRKKGHSESTEDIMWHRIKYSFSSFW